MHNFKEVAVKVFDIIRHRFFGGCALSNKIAEKITTLALTHHVFSSCGNIS